MGPCAKVQVICIIHLPDGSKYRGENTCATPQEVCPRLPGEGYSKCGSVCNQTGHAEVNAIAAVIADGKQVAGGHAVLHNHTWFCRDCQEALFAASIKSLSLNK